VINHPAIQPPDEPERRPSVRLSRKELKDTEAVENVRNRRRRTSQMVKALEEVLGGRSPTRPAAKPLGRAKDPKDLAEESERFKLDAL